MADLETQQQLVSENEAGDVSKGAQTHDVYKVKDIPARFDNPEWFQGYGRKNQHPMYKTSSATYGSRTPSVHTMPTTFHAKSSDFSQHLDKCGMYRNCSLNTAMD